MNEVDRARAERWLTNYKKAWEERDPGAAGRLFTSEATYRETPFVEPFKGRAAIEQYWAGAVSGQRDIAFSSDVLACSGDEAIAHWQVAFRAGPDGQPIELDGIFRLRFESEELVDRFEEWWHIKS